MGLFHKGLTAINESKRIVTNYHTRRRVSGSSGRAKKIYIAGIKKSGSTSLEAFLKSRGFVVVREESMFKHYAGPLKYRLQYPDYQALFIIREPIERIWSQYHYRRYYQAGKRNEIRCSFEEALTRHGDIITASDYRKWIDRWSSTNPIIVKLEELKKLEEFSRSNTTQKNPMTDEEREMIISACKRHGFDPREYDKIRHDNSIFEN